MSDEPLLGDGLGDGPAEFRTIFELAGVGMAQAEPASGRFVRVNRKLCEITGYSEAELLDMGFPQLTHPEDRERDFEIYQRAVRGEQDQWSIEKRYVRKSGAVIWVNVTASMIRDAAGRPLRSVAVIQDVTDRKLAEAGLQAAKEVVEAANRAKDHFLAVLSHELRTPLTPVLAAVSALEGEASLPAGVRSTLAMIRRNIELESRLIDDLLDLTRISRGKLELHRVVVDAREILEHAVSICCRRELAEGRLRLDLAAGDYRLRADGPRLTQVFWNLLSNAVKFTPAAGTVDVRSRVDAAAGQLVFEVEDTGIGIEPERLPFVFDAFEQTDRHITQRFGGLGLGLAVSKAIVELHGGTLTAASAGAGRGAKFTVRLPTGELGAEEEAGGAEALDETGGTGASAGRPLRILLVEDHADTADAMAELLRNLGYEVTLARDVKSALEAAGGGEVFDLVVSDIGLPDGTGLDLMRELKRRHALKGIALSGYGMEDDVRKSLEAGFDAHLTKPVTLAALKRAILRAAGREGSG